MVAPACPPPPNCPPGLEYLTLVDELLVIQKVEMLEVLTGWETNNKYAVKNSLGQHIFMIKEDTDACSRQCHGSARAFDMRVLDSYDREVAHFYRPFKCGAWWCCGCGCCLQEIVIESPPGHAIGFVRQDPSCCAPKWTVYREDQETPLIKIVGPACQGCSCFSDIEFQVLDLSGENKIGSVTKHWSGLAREYFTDADHFGISFPIDLDVKVKASLLGALMLIDFMFFENNQNRNRGGFRAF